MNKNKLANFESRFDTLSNEVTEYMLECATKIIKDYPQSVQSFVSSMGQMFFVVDVYSTDDVQHTLYATANDTLYTELKCSFDCDQRLLVSDEKKIAKLSEEIKEFCSIFDGQFYQDVFKLSGGDTRLENYALTGDVFRNTDF